MNANTIAQKAYYNIYLIVVSFVFASPQVSLTQIDSDTLNRQELAKNSPNQALKISPLKARPSSTSYRLLHQNDIDKVSRDILILFNNFLNDRVYKLSLASSSCAANDKLSIDYKLLDYELDTSSFELQTDSLLLRGHFVWSWKRVFLDNVQNCAEKGAIESEAIEHYKFNAIFKNEENYWIIFQIKAATPWDDEYYFYPKK